MAAPNAEHPCATDGNSSRQAPFQQADYETLAEFRYRLRRFIAFSDAAARRAGLTPRQHQALLQIKGAPGRDSLTVAELAERMRIRHHSAVGLVDRLAALGFVTRSPAPEDRRRVLVSLTPAAEAKLLRLSAAHRDELRAREPLLWALLDRFVRRRS